MSPSAHTPSTDVRRYSSTWMKPASSSSMPDSAAARLSVFGSRPVAMSTASTRSSDVPSPVGASSSSTASAPSARARAISVSSRRSKRRPYTSVKRVAMSSSSSSSSRSPRTRIVTSVPSSWKKWLISAVTKPPPTTASRRGSSGSRMTSSEVWTVTCSSPGIGGMVGRLPAAMTICGASIVRSSMTSRCDPLKRASPLITVMFGAWRLPFLDRPGVAVDVVEHALDDRRPVDPLDAGIDAEPVGPPDRARDVGHVDEHLRGDAAAVQARPPERTRDR